MGSVCCLLHNLIPGGSARQWIHLLGRHVGEGGEATIVAPPGLLEPAARAAGIGLVATSWNGEGQPGGTELEETLADHDLAIVHWDHLVMDALEPALSACSRVALTLHQMPHAPARWPGSGGMPAVRAPIARALAEERAAVLVRGESHRERVAAALGPISVDRCQPGRVGLLERDQAAGQLQEGEVVLVLL